MVIVYIYNVFLECIWVDSFIQTDFRWTEKNRILGDFYKTFCILRLWNFLHPQLSSLYGEHFEELRAILQKLRISKWRKIAQLPNRVDIPSRLNQWYRRPLEARTTVPYARPVLSPTSLSNNLTENVQSYFKILPATFRRKCRLQCKNLCPPRPSLEGQAARSSQIAAAEARRQALFGPISPPSSKFRHLQSNKLRTLRCTSR